MPRRCLIGSAYLCPTPIPLLLVHISSFGSLFHCYFCIALFLLSLPGPNERCDSSASGGSVSRSRIDCSYGLFLSTVLMDRSYELFIWILSRDSSSPSRQVATATDELLLAGTKAMLLIAKSARLAGFQVNVTLKQTCLSTFQTDAHAIDKHMLRPGRKF